MSERTAKTFVTKTGHVLTADDLDRMADEAERGFNLSKWVHKRGGSPPEQAAAADSSLHGAPRSANAMTTRTDGIQPDIPRDGMPDEDDDMRSEYDFSGGQRGRLFARLKDGYEIVISGPEGEQRIQVSAAEVRAQAAEIERLRKQRALKKSRRSISARLGSSGEGNG